MRSVVRLFACVAQKTFIAGICLALTLAGCLGPRPALNPPRLVLSTQTDMSIQLFMQATILLSNYYGFKTIRYSEIQERSNRAGFSTLPFMPPETVRATPELVNLANEYEDNPAMLDFIIQKYGYKALVKYYVRTGLRASQLICRNYILGLEESNEYLEFLRKEFGVAYTLATGILELTHANRTIQGAFLVSRSALDGAVTAYEEYRFMNIDREAARVLVEAAQNKYAEYFAQQVDKASTDPNAAAGGYTFSDAIHAVSTIEYQCTREGIRALLNRSVNNSPTNLEIDEKTGTIMFKSSKFETNAATGQTITPAVVPTARMPVPGASVAVPTTPVMVRTRPDARPPVIAPKRPTVAERTPPPEPTEPGQTDRPKPAPLCVKAPDDAAKKLIAFVCPDGKIVNAKRGELEKLMEEIEPTMSKRIMVVLSVSRHASLRQKLLDAATAEKLITQ
jgi:hypothetical protein